MFTNYTFGCEIVNTFSRAFLRTLNRSKKSLELPSHFSFETNESARTTGLGDTEGCCVYPRRTGRPSHLPRRRLERSRRTFPPPSEAASRNGDRLSSRGAKRGATVTQAASRLGR